MKITGNVKVFEYSGSVSYFDYPVDLLSLNDCSSDYYIFPGFCDVHVHFREPGFSYKETIMSGSAAAAHGGYTAVCTMPNLSPVPDCADNLKIQTDIIKRDSLINIFPYGSITVGRNGQVLSRMSEISDSVVAFSDDGSGVESEDIMLRAMQEAKKLNKIIVAHCEDLYLVNGGYVNLCSYSEKHNHKGICNESEYRQIERDLELVRKTGCKYHVCHVSCRESVELIRNAKASGLDVTCETAPHYLLLDDNSICEDGRYKMNPPLRSSDDRLALIEGILDGTVDMIATDHAPHSIEEKSLGLKDSAFGIVGLECSFSLLYTYLVKEKVISLAKLIELMSVNPRLRFSIELNKDFCVWDLNKRYTVDEKNFLSKGKSTPFIGTDVCGECLFTVVNNKIVYKK